MRLSALPISDLCSLINISETRVALSRPRMRASRASGGLTRASRDPDETSVVSAQTAGLTPGAQLTRTNPAAQTSSSESPTDVPYGYAHPIYALSLIQHPDLAPERHRTYRGRTRLCVGGAHASGFEAKHSAMRTNPSESGSVEGQTRAVPHVAGACSALAFAMAAAAPWRACAGVLQYSL